MYLDSRLDFLRSNQNTDGGWGYFPGKQSWFEPTTYAMLALQGTAGSEASLDRAWKFIRSLQTSDGSSRPSAQVQGGTWVTAQAITLAAVRGVYDTQVRSSVDWMLRVAGAESNWMVRTMAYFHQLSTKADFSHQAWPWRDGNASWIEPTAHALVALKKISGHYDSPKLEHRVHEGEEQILSRRCSDGGWNCGNPNVLNLDLPSYPETTALALLGLQGRSTKELEGPLAVARRFRTETKSSLAKAWLSITLLCYGEKLEDPPEDSKVSADVMLMALQAIAHPSGNHHLFSTQGARA